MKNVFLFLLSVSMMQISFIDGMEEETEQRKKDLSSVSAKGTLTRIYNVLPEHKKLKEGVEVTHVTAHPTKSFILAALKESKTKEAANYSLLLMPYGLH